MHCKAICRTGGLGHSHLGVIVPEFRDTFGLMMVTQLTVAAVSTGLRTGGLLFKLPFTVNMHQLIRIIISIASIAVPADIVGISLIPAGRCNHIGHVIVSQRGQRIQATQTALCAVASLTTALHTGSRLFHNPIGVAVPRSRDIRIGIGISAAAAGMRGIAISRAGNFLYRLGKLMSGRFNDALLNQLTAHAIAALTSVLRAGYLYVNLPTPEIMPLWLGGITGIGMTAIRAGIDRISTLSAGSRHKCMRDRVPNRCRIGVHIGILTTHAGMRGIALLDAGRLG